MLPQLTPGPPQSLSLYLRPFLSTALTYLAGRHAVIYVKFRVRHRRSCCPECRRCRCLGPCSPLWHSGDPDFTRPRCSDHGSVPRAVGPGDGCPVPRTSVLPPVSPLDVTFFECLGYSLPWTPHRSLPSFFCLSPISGRPVLFSG